MFRARCSFGISKLNSGWMHMLSSYRPVNGKMPVPNKRTRAITLKRRYQTKERVQLLCNGVTKQKNAPNYFETALPNKRTRPITLKRRFLVIHWIQSDSPGPLRDDSPSNPCSLSSL